MATKCLTTMCKLRLGSFMGPKSIKTLGNQALKALANLEHTPNSNHGRNVVEKVALFDLLCIILHLNNK